MRRRRADSVAAHLSETGAFKGAELRSRTVSLLALMLAAALRAAGGAGRAVPGSVVAAYHKQTPFILRVRFLVASPSWRTYNKSAQAGLYPDASMCNQFA